MGYRLFALLSAATLFFASASFVACESEQNLHESNRAKDGAHAYQINEDGGHGAHGKRGQAGGHGGNSLWGNGGNGGNGGDG